MATVVLKPFRFISTFLQNQKAKAEERRRQDALFQLSKAFDHYELSLEELTDSELEALVGHMGEIIAEIVRRKRQALQSVLNNSREAIKQS